MGVLTLNLNAQTCEAIKRWRDMCYTRMGNLLHHSDALVYFRSGWLALIWVWNRPHPTIRGLLHNRLRLFLISASSGFATEFNSKEV